VFGNAGLGLAVRVVELAVAGSTVTVAWVLPEE
jgi:hypothetical protein